MWNLGKLSGKQKDVKNGIRKILIQSNLDLVRKIFGPFNKETFKIDLDIVRTSILCEFFSVPWIALYQGSTILKKFGKFKKSYRFRTDKILIFEKSRKFKILWLLWNLNILAMLKNERSIKIKKLKSWKLMVKICKSSQNLDLRGWMFLDKKLTQNVRKIFLHINPKRSRKIFLQKKPPKSCKISTKLC
jgi:hypothetical protein